MSKLENIELKTEQEPKKEGIYGSWEVIDYCDLNCPHCYSTYHEKWHKSASEKFVPELSGLAASIYERLPLEKIKQGLDNLRSAGFTSINIEGGEPTLRKDIIDILEDVKEKGMQTILSTHGMYMLKKRKGSESALAEEMRGKLDYIGLSLDADNAEINNAIRVKHSGEPSNHFEEVLRFLEWYGEEFKTKQETGKPLYGLKINTVVMRKNKESVVGIVDLIKKYIPAEAKVQLKIIQFIPRGQGRITEEAATKEEEKLSVDKEEFSQVVEKVKQAAGQDIEVTVREYSGGDYPFVVVHTSGIPIIPEDEKQESLIQLGMRQKELNVAEPSFAEDFKSIIVSRYGSVKNFIDLNKRKADTYTQK